MTIAYFLHDADGRIWETCVAAAPPPVRHGWTLREGAARVGDYYDARSGTVQKLPARPSAVHVFDYQARVWVPDWGKAWSDIRRERASRLAACDWVTLPDVPLTEAQRVAWYSYRQALRDVTAQPDPLVIRWPTPPV